MSKGIFCQPGRCKIEKQSCPKCGACICFFKKHDKCFIHKKVRQAYATELHSDSFRQIFCSVCGPGEDISPMDGAAGC
jgi:hypothetical protein